ncbi:response regulator transcription factor [Paucibacter sp. APW11]|uniref:Response regulator transcription factor n=1 Tax=Roseateles aquae TaxID=3077235 RepID=A0ABU3PFK1_9BURK|nr:response regulator transcription factor [Paucibacter sp. APW11]MDT9000868.1 response regulator transcription factor [Paucibacter sp. APW11]
MHVLLIEDDLALGQSLQAALRAEGHSSHWWRRAADAPLRLDDEPLDAVLLDLGLPDGSGQQLLARWRAQGSSVPILLITARAALQDRLDGFDAGADDYLIKPFEIPELLARLRVAVRRAAQQSSDVWQFGALRIEAQRHRALLNDQELALSPREFQLLLALARENGGVVPKAQLAQRMVPLGEALDFGALEVHLSNLRRKIGSERIGTLRGVGYWLQSL